MSYIITCNSSIISVDLDKKEWYHDFRLPFRQVVLISQCRCEDDPDCEHCIHRMVINDKYANEKNSVDINGYRFMYNDELFINMNAEEMEKFHNSYMDGRSPVFNFDLSNIIFNEKLRLPTDQLNVFLVLTETDNDDQSIKVQGFLDFEKVKKLTKKYKYNCLQFYLHLSSFCL